MKAIDNLLIAGASLQPIAAIILLWSSKAAMFTSLSAIPIVFTAIIIFSIGVAKGEI